jgi:hypothetical protein
MGICSIDLKVLNVINPRIEETQKALSGTAGLSEQGT